MPSLHDNKPFQNNIDSPINAVAYDRMDYHQTVPIAPCMDGVPELTDKLVIFTHKWADTVRFQELQINLSQYGTRGTFIPLYRLHISVSG